MLLGAANHLFSGLMSLKALAVNAPAANILRGSRNVIGLEREVETIKVHHLVPGGDEVANKFLLRVRASVNFRQSTENGV
jgi:hypothetical protein